MATNLDFAHGILRFLLLGLLALGLGDAGGGTGDDHD